MTNATATNLTTTVDNYLAMCNQTDRAERGRLLASSWASDGRYWDPQKEVSGYTEIEAAVVHFQEQLPGHNFQRTSAVDVHHEFLRFTWDLVAPDGSIKLTGTDVGMVNAEGRLTRIVGFFGPLAARE